MSGDRGRYQSAMREGHAYAWQLQWESAVAQYRQAVEEFPDDPPAQNSLATACYRAGYLSEALKHYERLIGLTAADETVLTRVVEIRQREGEPAQLTRAYLDLADYRLRLGDRAAAAAAWLDLATALPDNLDTQERLYQAVSKAGEVVLAAKTAQAITRLRGEQAGLAGNSLAGPRPAGDRPRPMAEPESPVSSGQPATAEAGAQTVALASEHLDGGRPEEALLSYAEAAAGMFARGAAEEAWKVAEAAESLAQRYGGLRFRDLLPLEPPSRRVVLESLIASRKSLEAGLGLAAIDVLIGGICSAPSCLPLQERLAEAQGARGAKDEAIATLASLTRLYLLRGEPERAVEMLRRLLALGHVAIGTWEHALTMLVERGARDQAARQADHLSRYLLDAGKIADAIAVLSSLATRLDAAAVFVRLGEALESAGQMAEAVKAYERAVQHREADGEAAQRLAVAALTLGKLPLAMAGLEAIVESIASSEVDGSAARQALATALAVNGQSIELQVGYGTILTHLRSFADAFVHLSKGADSPGLLGAVARLGLARCTLESESADACVKHLVVLQRLLMERDPQQKAGWRWVARESQRIVADIALTKGELEKAVAALENVRRLAPDDMRVHAQLAEAHFRRGDQDAAVGALERLGDLHRDRGGTENALLVYRGALQVAQANVELGRKLASLCLSQGQTDEAFAVWGQLATAAEVAGRKGDAVSLLREMVERCRQSDPALALSLRERIARLLPEDAEAAQDLTSGYLAAGNSSAALAEALRLWQTMVAAGRFAEARAALQQALRIDPWNAEALLGLGGVCESMGDCEGAMEAYRRVVSSDPANAAATGRLEALESSRRSAG